MKKNTTTKRTNKIGLSDNTDMIVAIMNLSAIEGLLNKSRMRGKNETLAMIQKIRDDLVEDIIVARGTKRGTVRGLLVPLFAEMAKMVNTGNQQLAAGKPDKAYDSFAGAYELYSRYSYINDDADDVVETPVKKVRTMKKTTCKK